MDAKIDFSFSDDPELQKLSAQVLEDPEEFENWEKLVRAAEGQEGGLHRNSSPGAIASTREVYDKFLARFPLFFGYWKKYADLEFSIAGTEAAEMVYERGVASIGTSVDLWANYCAFKVETSHDTDVIRELFERGADSVGLDFLSHPFWDKYLEFEERVESQDKYFAILGRIVHIPMHQYARYFERYRSMSPKQPLTALALPETIAQISESIMQTREPPAKNEAEIEQEVRTRLDDIQLEMFHGTQAETTKRWPYEQPIKRPYYHVTELDDEQLENWRKYLGFEEGEGDYVRTKFLYERCIVTAANYEEFWLRYARWMLAQPNKLEEVRNIYQRASCVYVPISQPTIRLFYAHFEEYAGRPSVAAAIHEAIILNSPSHTETIISLANVYRRQYGVQSASELLQKYIAGDECNPYTKGALVSELARLSWKIQGDTNGARQIYLKYQDGYPDSRAFWSSWLAFELEQPTSETEEPERYERITSVFEAIRQRSRVSPGVVKELAATYLDYLKERGGKDAMREYMRLDQELYGPGGVALSQSDENRSGSKAQGRAVLENGHRVL